MVIAATDWARLAAFLDGEGCICVSIDGAKKPHHSKRYKLQIEITNTDKAIVDWCKAVFGGNVYVKSHVGSGKSRRTCYMWVETGKQAANLLWGCLPYFIAKEKQAKTAITFTWTFGTKYRRVPEDVNNAREILYRHLRKLKEPKLEALLAERKVEVPTYVQ